MENNLCSGILRLLGSSSGGKGEMTAKDVISAP